MESQSTYEITEVGVSSKFNIPEYADDDEKKMNEEPEVVQVESVEPSFPVTFYFVGLRPRKAHLENNQVCDSKVSNVALVRITFDNVTLNDTVATLKKAIAAEFEIPPMRSLLVMYANVRLVCDEVLLKDYGVTDRSCLLLALYDNSQTNHIEPEIKAEPNEDEASRAQRIRKQNRNNLDIARRRFARIQSRMHGTNLAAETKVNASETKQNADAEQQQLPLQVFLRKQLKKLSIEYIQGTDIVTLEQDVRCMKLPQCKHIMSESSLFEYVLQQFKDREQALKCPHPVVDKNNALCAQQWHYPVIKQYLQSMDEDSLHSIELYAARNVVELNYEIQKCKHCHTLLYRNKQDSNYAPRTECVFCASEFGSFCWCCSEKWSDGHICDTSFKAQIMQILSMAAVKNIGKAHKVPSVRACPNCHQLINHHSACKHIKCSFCKTDFCFVCLKTREKWIVAVW
jgi:hypothetical protein